MYRTLIYLYFYLFKTHTVAVCISIIFTFHNTFLKSKEIFVLSCKEKMDTTTIPHHDAKEPGQHRLLKQDFGHRSYPPLRRPREHGS